MSNQNENVKRVAINAVQKKLLGKKLSYKEIYSIMDEIASERFGDVLTTYFVAGSFKEGYTDNELFQFTKAMVETGNRLHFSGIVADKHSIGGVSGTRVTMILVPIIAASGFKIPKISSRAITTPAGTADVMEVLANVNFLPKEVEDIVNTTNGCICWNRNLGIAPADDVIIQVEKPLSFESFDKMIMSVMAKKIAASTTHLILDIPYGKTMKIHRISDAEKVVQKSVFLGKKFGIKVVGKPIHTIEPAGNGVGPVLEAIDVLRVLEQDKNRPLALENRALSLASALLNLCYQNQKEKKDGLREATDILKNGLALQKFKDIVLAQGGNPNINSHSLKTGEYSVEIVSSKSGKVHEIQNHNLHKIAQILGAPKDKRAGIYLYKKTGDIVHKNEPLMKLYSSQKYLLREAQTTLKIIPVYTIT